jgi:hypothetical protein
MTDAIALTATTPILDGETYRSDCDGVARFYRARLYPEPPRNGIARVKVRVELEGDPSAWAIQYCDDDAESVNEAMLDCVADIEDECWDQWTQEINAELADMRASEERFYYR